MDRLLAAMCREYCSESLVITRNEESRTILRQLGIPTELGTDTAWTFEPHGPEYGRKVLRDAGWNGNTPVLVVCPIDPFCWPVKASLGKGIARALTGAFRESHYRSIYFHNGGPKAKENYQRYLTGLSDAVQAFRHKHPIFTVLVAMERLDTRACRDLSERLGSVPIFSSAEYDMYELVSILRSCDMMVSSRYHGIVTCMPALVASAGVTMDERIRNLMQDRGQPELFLEADDPDLAAKLEPILEKLLWERDAIAEAIGRSVARNLKLMAQMGIYFEEHVQRRYPDFPIRSGVVGWENYLPPLSPNLCGLLERFA